MQRYCTLLLLLFFSFTLAAQTSTSAKTEVQLAHDLKGKSEEFTKTKNGLFKAKVYTVKTATTNKMHHWFLQITDENDAFINYGSVQMDAYHESDKSIKLNYLNPVFAMCQEGKYVIGFVNVEKAGKYILDLEIKQFGKTDNITLEMEVGE